MKNFNLIQLLLGGCFLLNSSLLYSQEIKTKPSTRFVILADRTGGEEKGIFPQIIEEINTLSPDFVISVGDLIDGYTTDENYLKKLWSEFEDIKGKLKVPFYPVPGNHDISNEWMAEKWEEHWGYSYRILEVENNLFLLLNTEEEGGGKISQKQVDYFQTALKKYNGNGWIYVFMHRPLWKSPDNNGYEKISALLENREKVIVFSGHEHHYLKRTIKGQKHYVLATSGGGNNLRNNFLGEFHHFFFVTMSDKEPIVSNILYNGIISEDIVCDTNEKLVNSLRDDSWIKILPTLLTDNYQDTIPIKIEISPATSSTIKVECTFPEEKGLKYSTSVVSTGITGQKLVIEEQLYNRKKENLSLMNPLELQLRVDAQGENEKKRITTNFKKKWLWDIERVCTAEEQWIDCPYPYYIKEEWDWHGMEDGAFSFSLSHSLKNLVLQLKLVDDIKIENKENPQALQDKVFLRFSSHLQHNNNENKEIILVGEKMYDKNYREIKKAKVQRQSNLLTLTIPKNYLRLGNKFSFNIGFMDHDNLLNQKPSILWWRPLESDSRGNPIFGIFIFE